MKMNAQMAGRLGAIRRNSLYGNPGTQASRRQGGFSSYNKFKSQSRFGIKTGFKLEKTITIPEPNSLLAEFIGIVLGDGSINDYQVKIYFNSQTDVDFAHCVQRMIKDLFSIKSTIFERCKNTLELVVSSVGVVRFLISVGLKKGNKIKNQVEIPRWIRKEKEYLFACLRGLMDTDGGIYFHTHTTKGHTYKNIVLCFTNRSAPLLNAVEQALVALGINAKNNFIERVLVYNRIDIARYMEVVGSHNPNFLKRYRSFKA